jgi:predicted Zn-dependent protease
VTRLKKAVERFSDSAALKYRYAELLIDTRQPADAQRFLADELRVTLGDAKLHRLMAKSYAALGRQGAQHRAQGEAYALLGQLSLAVEQMDLAQRSKDNDFFEQSVIDARLRQLKARQLEEMRQPGMP